MHLFFLFLLIFTYFGINKMVLHEILILRKKAESILVYVYQERILAFSFFFSVSSLTNGTVGGLILFWDKIFEMEILRDLYVLRSPGSIFLEVGMFLSLSLCVSIFYQHSSKTINSNNSKCSILQLYHM